MLPLHRSNQLNKVVRKQNATGFNKKEKSYNINRKTTLAEKPFILVRKGNPIMPIGLEINITSMKEAFHRCNLLTVLYQGCTKSKLLASRCFSNFCLFSD